MYRYTPIAFRCYEVCKYVSEENTQGEVNCVLKHRHVLLIVLLPVLFINFLCSPGRLTPNRNYNICQHKYTSVL